MTTIAAYVDRETGHVAMAADGALTGSIKHKLKHGKIYTAGELRLGYAGVAPPVGMRFRDYPATEAGVLELAEELFDMMRTAGHGTTVVEEGIAVLPTTAIIVGPGLDPYLVTVSGSVEELLEPYVAVGTGEELATGVLNALHTLRNENDFLAMMLDPLSIVLRAVRTACEHDPTSGGPINYQEFGRPQENVSENAEEI